MFPQGLFKYFCRLDVLALITLFLLAVFCRYKTRLTQLFKTHDDDDDDDDDDS